MHYFGYITKKDEYKINSVNPLYSLAHRMDSFIEKKERIKYLNITSTVNNSGVLKNMRKLGVASKIVLKK